MVSPGPLPGPRYSSWTTRPPRSSSAADSKTTSGLRQSVTASSRATSPSMLSARRAFSAARSVMLSRLIREESTVTSAGNDAFPKLWSPW
jgi:hypothetical protein